MNPENLSEFIKGKKFVAIAVMLGIFLIVLMIFSTGSKTQPSSTLQPTLSVPREPPQTDSFFNSSSDQSVELQRAVEEQTKVDQEYASWEKDISDNYPWRKKLPLTSENYYVYFDLNNKVFIGRLYTTAGDDVEQLKADILKILKVDEEIPIENFKFEWMVFPK